MVIEHIPHSDSGSSGLSTLIKYHLAGGASPLTALLLPQILPVFSVDAPCHPGAALRDLVLVQRGQTTDMERPRQISCPLLFVSIGKCRIGGSRRSCCDG